MALRVDALQQSWTMTKRKELAPQSTQHRCGARPWSCKPLRRTQLFTRPGGRVAGVGDSPNLGRFVAGCIDAESCNKVKRLIFRHSWTFTRLTRFCIARKLTYLGFVSFYKLLVYFDYFPDVQKTKSEVGTYST